MNRDWLVPVCVTALIGWLGWITILTIGNSADIRAIALTQTNVIPPVVEQSLKELRDKGNVESRATNELLAKLTETAIGNAKDIGYMRQEITNLKPK